MPSMRPLTHILVGMAAAGVVAGPQRPLALVAGAVAGVLPDVIDWWLRQVFRQPDITVTPDPLAPDPATLSQGVRVALQQARVTGRPCVVRFNPLPARDAGFTTYHLDCDRRHRLVVALESGDKPAPVDPPGAGTNAAEVFSPLHPLPLRITDMPVDLHLVATGRRIESRDLEQVAGAGHGLPAAGAAAAAGFAWSFWSGAGATAALAAHLLLELGGRREAAPWLPFSGRTWHGRRLWDERGWCANACAGVVAGAIIVALLFAAR